MLSPAKSDASELAKRLLDPVQIRVNRRRNIKKAVLLAASFIAILCCGVGGQETLCRVSGDPYARYFALSGNSEAADLRMQQALRSWHAAKQKNRGSSARSPAPLKRGPAYRVGRPDMMDPFLAAIIILYTQRTPR